MPLDYKDIFCENGDFNGNEFIHPDKLSTEYCLNIKTQEETTPGAFCVLSFNLPKDAQIYCEGYQMLSLTAGIFSHPRQVGRINEVSDYKMYAGLDGILGSNFLAFRVGKEWNLIGTTTCNETDIFFRKNGDTVEVYWDLENITIGANTDYGSEYLCIISASSREELLTEYSERINLRVHHAPLQKITGWCSWYAYYEKISEELIRQNLAVMRDNLPELEYLQIDDGYQPYMGDWLEECGRFNKGLKQLCEDILASGHRPAIWVAPFIASEKSKLFREHKDWFIQDESGKPVKAEDCTYGGWRDLPWYMLDTTLHEVREHLKKIFRIFRKEYGISYFKLDAAYWGAVKHLKSKTPGVTAISRYRLGMYAIREGAGFDACLVGCNAPLWPSLGYINIMRLGDDIARNQERVNQISENLRIRSWMADELWCADPDCVVTADVNGEKLPQAACNTDIALAYILGGSVILGDPLKDVKENGGHYFFKKFLGEAGLRKRSLPKNTALTVFKDDNDIITVFGGNSGEPLAKYIGMYRIFAAREVLESDIVKSGDAEILIPKKCLSDYI